ARHEPSWLRKADVVTSESNWGIEKLTEFVPCDRLRRVEYGVHPSFYDVAWRPDPARPIALFCGALVARKGIDILMDAIDSLSDRTWVCRIAGDGPFRSIIERQHRPGVELLGELTWDALREELSRAWCL